MTRTCFHPAHISTSKGAYNPCCHYGRKALLIHIATTSCHVLIFYGWVNQSPHNAIAAHGASTPRPFGYESYALTNCAITARQWIRIVNFDTNSQWSVQQSATHRLGHSYILSMLSFGDDKVYQVSVSGTWGEFKTSYFDGAEGIHCWWWTIYVLRMFLAAVPHCCCIFRHRVFPRTPSQVVWSVPTLASKSRRNSTSCRWTDLIVVF